MLSRINLKRGIVEAVALLLIVGVALSFVYLVHRNNALRQDLAQSRVELIASNKRHETTEKLYTTALSEIKRLNAAAKAKEAELNELFSNDTVVRDWGSPPIPQRLLDSL